MTIRELTAMQFAGFPVARSGIKAKDVGIVEREYYVNEDGTELGMVLFHPSDNTFSAVVLGVSNGRKDRGIEPGAFAPTHIGLSHESIAAARVYLIKLLGGGPVKRVTGGSNKGEHS